VTDRYRALADEFGTPLYVYDLDRLTQAAHDLRAALPPEAALYYSLKANPHPLLASELRVAFGACAEISSSGELAAAETGGFTGAECLYTGPAKTREEIEVAITHGVRLFSVESLADLRRVGRVAAAHGVVADCLVRANGTTGSAASIRMSGTASRFGVDADVLEAEYERFAEVPNTRLRGLHFFPLSNARHEQDLVDEFARSAATAASLSVHTGLALGILDLGGGFATPYAEPGDRPRYRTLRAGLTAALDEHLPQWRNGTPQLAFESGRYLTGDCGTLVCRVTEVKRSRGKEFTLLDAGINVLGGMSGLGRLLAGQIRPDFTDADAATTTLTGPLCTPADTWASKLSVPALHDGDLISIPNVGAYGLTASLLAFLSRPIATEVVVRGEVPIAVTRHELRSSTRIFDVPPAGQESTVSV
jgi:diaminopimelate decarboxylase